MFDRAEEGHRISMWLNKLNTHSLGWTDGDSESRKIKTADLINHESKIAIELKREKGESLDNKDGNIISLSNRMEKYLQSANQKFRSYPGYKTLLIIELTSNLVTAQVLMRGIPQLHFQNGIFLGQSVKNARFYSEADYIGGIVLWPAPGSRARANSAYYFDNPTSRGECKVLKAEAERLLGNILQDFYL